jgi:sugar lactone lactonase YvrE
VALGTGAYARANAALTIDTANNLYSASGDSIYKITPAGNVTLQAKLQDSSGYNTINGVAIDAAGNLYVSNYYNVRKVSSSGAVSMINGVEPYLLGRYFSGSDGWSGAVNDLQGNAYLNLDRKLVRIGIDGSQTVLAPELGGYSIAIAPDGSIYAAGFTNLGLSRLGRDGKITEIAGSAGYTIKLGELPGNIGVAQGLAVDARGLVYLSVGHAILRVGPPASDSTGTK